VSPSFQSRGTEKHFEEHFVNHLQVRHVYMQPCLVLLLMHRYCGVLYRSVFFVLNQQDFVNASFLPSSQLSSTAAKPSKAPAAEPSSQSEALNLAVTSVPDNGSATREKTVSIGSYIDSVPPIPLAGDTEAPAVPGPTFPDTSFASQGESGGLPDGWTAHVDSASKKTYYLSAANGKTTWEKPSALPASPTEI